ncbi:MAG: hypothetical protein ACODAJ_03350 [Planctomycetota bacterium]
MWPCLAVLALAWTACGCAGLRLGAYGVGILPMRVHRAVHAQADWSPDDQFVLIEKHRDKRVTRASFLLTVLTIWEKDYPDRYAIYRVPVPEGEPLTWIGPGQDLEIAPAGTFAAYVEEHDPPEKGAAPQRRLWLVDYAAPDPEPTALDEDVEHYSFSLDGQWLSWKARGEGGWKVAPVARPEQVRLLDEPLEFLTRQGWDPDRWGMPRGRWRWSADGALYRVLTRWDRTRKALAYRWVRFVPPDWTLEDLGTLPAHAKPAALREERPSRPHGLAYSRDGSMRLMIDVKRRVRKGIAFTLGLPEKHTEVANVLLILPDHQRRPLTHFR